MSPWLTLEPPDNSLGKLNSVKFPILSINSILVETR